MFATDTNLSDRNLLSLTWSEVINIYLLRDEELNLLTKDNLMVREDVIVARHVEIFGS